MNLDANLVMLFKLSKPSQLIICPDTQVIQQTKMLNIINSNSSNLPLLGLPNVVIDPISREVMGLSYYRVNSLQDDLVKLMAHFDERYVNYIDNEIKTTLKRYSDEAHDPNHSFEILWGNPENCIVEPASLMGDYWLNDTQGKVALLKMEWSDFIDPPYWIFPDRTIIEVTYL